MVPEESWLWLHGVTLHSPVRHHGHITLPMPGSLSYTGLYSHTREGARCVKSYECQKEVSEKHFYPANLCEELDFWSLKADQSAFAETQDFPPILISMVNEKGELWRVQLFNYALSCLALIDLWVLPWLSERRGTVLIFGHDTDKLCDPCRVQRHIRCIKYSIKE